MLPSQVSFVNRRNGKMNSPSTVRLFSLPGMVINRDPALGERIRPPSLIRLITRDDHPIGRNIDTLAVSKFISYFSAGTNQPAEHYDITQLLPYASSNRRYRGETVSRVFSGLAPVLEITMTNVNGNILPHQNPVSMHALYK